MLATETALPRTLDEAYTWNLSPLAEQDNDQLAVLNPDSRFMLHPFVEGDDGVYYQPNDGWLEVSIAAFDWEEQTISFRVHNNTLPGVGLEKMHVARGLIEDVDHNFLRLTVHGLTFDGETTVDWISFEDFEQSTD